MTTTVPNEATEKDEILTFVRARLRFTVGEISENCAMPEWRLQNFIRQLKRDGLFTACGRSGRAQHLTVWGAKAAMDIINAARTGAISETWAQDYLARIAAQQPESGTSNAVKAPEIRSAREQEIWDYIRHQPFFTKDDLDIASAGSPNSRDAFLKRLRDSGIVQVLHKGSSKVIYSAQSRDDARIAASELRAKPEGAIWQVMRINRRFTAQDLQAALFASRPDISAKKILDYCRVLRRAGYITAQGNPPKLLETTLFTISKNTGPLPPVETKLTVLVDTNENKIVHAPRGRL